MVGDGGRRKLFAQVEGLVCNGRAECSVGWYWTGAAEDRRGTVNSDVRIRIRAR